jgi:RimJ/RimL family protein N-acetyltransferase
MKQFLEFMDTVGRQKADWIFFAVLDLTKEVGNKPWGEGKLAGIISLLNTDADNHSTEIGCIIIGKEFQRTHVTTNAVGLLLQWCFSILGMRRVQWQTNSRNEPSVATAKKMHFRDEGILRWQRVLPKEQTEVGEYVEGHAKEAPGRHTVMLSICWDDWDAGVKDIVAERMARTL